MSIAGGDSNKCCFWDRWSQRPKEAAGELLMDQQVQLLKKALENSRQASLKLWSKNRQKG
jgi:uncharacterized membrane protein